MLFFTETVNKCIIKAYIDISNRITVGKFLNIHLRYGLAVILTGYVEA